MAGARREAGAGRRKPGQHNWVHGLPLKMRFPRSRLYISAIPPLLIGAAVGLLAAFLGVGGGFIMVPAMIYLLRMPTNIVIGTSLFQIIFITAIVTLLHATLQPHARRGARAAARAGGVIGGQFGVSAGQKLKGEQLRALLALMVLAVALRLLLDLVLKPDELYSIVPLRGRLMRYALCIAAAARKPPRRARARRRGATAGRGTGRHLDPRGRTSRRISPASRS